MSKYFKRTNKFADLSAQYDLVDTLVAGTASMIAAGETYLPKEPAESMSTYRIRLNNSTLAPYYKRTIAKAVGKAFAKGINVQTPAPLEYLIDSVDGSGTSLETFSKQLLHSAINYGITYILVDMPINDSVTIADAQRNNAQPYMVEIKPTQVLDVKTDYIGSKVTLTYFRFQEDVIEYSVDGLLQTSISQVKEFSNDGGRVLCNIYRKEKGGKEYLYAAIDMVGFTQIPIVPVYANKLSPFIGSPVLMDLAHLNVKHWRKQSDADWAEHFSMTPILALKGFNQTPDAEGNIQEFIISANTSVVLPSDGSIEWVKGDASTMQQARESLKHLEDQMEKFGLELTVQQATGTETATGRMIDAAESNSILKTIVIDLEWAIYNAIVIAGQLIGVDATQTVLEMDKTYTVSNSTDISLLKDLFAAGILDRDEVRRELATRRILLSESIDLTTPSNNAINNTVE